MFPSELVCFNVFTKVRARMFQSTEAEKLFYIIVSIYIFHNMMILRGLMQ